MLRRAAGRVLGAAALATSIAVGSAGCSGRGSTNPQAAHVEETPSPRSFVRDSLTLDIALRQPPTDDRSVAEAKPIYRYRFDVPLGYGHPPLPAISGELAYVTRLDGVYAFNLASHQENRLATAGPGAPLYISGNSLVIGSPPSELTNHVTAIDRFRGTRLWQREARLLGADMGHVLAVAPVKNNDDDSNGVFVDIDSARGTLKWSHPSTVAGCAAQGPVTFVPGWAILTWAGVCGVSANEGFLVWVRLRDGSSQYTDDSTAFLARRGPLVYLTGDDRHYGEYGPGNFSIFHAATGQKVLTQSIAPDRPASDEEAFSANIQAYALANALWVGIGNGYRNVFSSAVYRYDLQNTQAPPARVDPAFGHWLAAARDDETYFEHENALVALRATSAKCATGITYAGRLSDAGEAVADDRYVYVREKGGRIATFDRTTYRQVGIVAAGCSRLEAVETFGEFRYAICADGLTAPGETFSRDALIEFRPES
jgi:outer membrane protein assembly factor BamB